MSMTRREFCGLAAATMANVIVLPIVVKPLARGLPELPTFGAQIEEYQAVTKTRWLAPGGLTRYRIRWDDVETAPGVYAWRKVDDDFSTAVWAMGCKLLVNVICAPQFYSGSAIRCAPPLPEHAPRLVAFVQALIERYNPTAIELWNEPEVTPAEAQGINAAHVLGGFGMAGASYYGELVNAVWQGMQAGWYSTWLVAGSLMMSDGGAFWLTARDKCAGCYDALGFHSYCVYPGIDYAAPGRKVDMLRAYGETVPLILSETALLADNDSPLFRDAQATYLHYQADNRVEHGLASVLWYTLSTNLWRNSDLVVWDEPQPAWYQYQEEAR